MSNYCVIFPVLQRVTHSKTVKERIERLIERGITGLKTDPDNEIGKTAAALGLGKQQVLVSTRMNGENQSSINL